MAAGGCNRDMKLVPPLVGMAVLAVAGCGTSSVHRAAAGCVPTPIVHGTPPAWSNAAWSMSSQPVTVPYALASGGVAMAVEAVGSIRAGHPTNPTNKVLWVMRLPRQGKPLEITARQGGRVVRINRPADSSPGEIYPSFVDLPTPGCWRLTLAWNRHRASINVNVQPRGAQHQPSS